MNELKHLFYKLTHSLLCLFGKHRLIHWCQNSSACGGDTIFCDMECWCGEEYGGAWNA